MKRLIRFLLTGDWHLHRFEVIRQVGCTNDDGGKWMRIYSRCSVCGEIKVFDAE